MERNKIKVILKEILNKLSLQFDDIEVLDDDFLIFMIRTNDARMIIGDRGDNLRAIKHLLSKMTEDNEGNRVNFSVDVNDYLMEKVTEIKTKAKILSERAKSFGVNVEMEPMNPYNRMIVHSFLSETPEIKTESTGFGKERRVVIKYIREESF